VKRSGWDRIRKVFRGQSARPPEKVRRGPGKKPTGKKRKQYARTLTACDFEKAGGTPFKPPFNKQPKKVLRLRKTSLGKRPGGAWGDREVGFRNISWRRKRIPLAQRCDF